MTESKSITTYKQQLRERIVHMAMRAFAAQGIRAVKMDDIAQALGISKRTLYELYDNKEDLLYAGMLAVRQQKEADMAQVVSRAKSVMDILLYNYRKTVEESHLTTPQFYADMVKYPKVMALLQESHQKNHKRMLQFLRRGVKEGYFRSDVDYDLISGLFDSIGHYIMSNELYRQYSVKQLFQNLVFSILRGVCTQRGVETLDHALQSFN